ncbi:MAG: DoxX family membrane protein [Anaerolineae bacterium]
MDILFLMGRIVLGGYYLFNASNHFMRLEMMSGYAGSKGVPSPRLAVAGSGIILGLGGLSILLGFQPVIGVALIVIFLVPVAFMMHNFWAVEDPQMKMAEMVNFTKNLALAASALMFLAIPTPWSFSLGG